MADQTGVRPVAALGGIAGNAVLPPVLAPVGPGVAAATVLWAGEMGGLDASGNAVSASNATCVTVMGIVRRTADNRTTGTPPTSGLAGAITCEFLVGPYSVLNDGTVTSATQFGADIYVVDNQTGGAASSGGARARAGYFVGLDPVGNIICQFGASYPCDSQYGTTLLFTPVNGANTLTAAQSQSPVIILAAGASAGVTLTINRPLANAGWVMIRNNTNQIVTAGFATGAGVAIAVSPKAVFLYSDGVQAQIGLNGT